MPINDTHDPALRSWVESANDPGSEFPIQNLPWCMVDDGASSRAFPAVRVGDEYVNLRALEEAGRFADLHLPAGLAGESLLGVAAWPAPAHAAVRARLVSLLAAGKDVPADVRACVRPLRDARVVLPLRPPNYTDFYASIHHAATVGAMFRPDNPLLPNYKHVPIGYHGRASSIVPSGTPVRRPRGQQSPPEDNPGAGPAYGPCTMLDYELEVGCVIAGSNPLGEPVPVARARERILGLTLVNDWSARDVQKWEYQPLGPFLAKNFATTVSPYIVTLGALEPFRCPAYARPAGDPRPLPYLFDEHDQAAGGFDVTLEVWLQSAAMRQRGQSPLRLSQGRGFKDMYWTFAQMIAHHASNGCNLEAGDLLASGTVSGPTPGSRGCLLELTWDGPGKPRRPIELPTGEKRTFLADGDRVIFRGCCEREGFRRIGFGECEGTVTPAGA
jgi:fumarylacetoacetase